MFTTWIRPHALAMMARLCMALALVAPLHLLGLPMLLVAGGAMAMSVLLMLPLLEDWGSQEEFRVQLTRAVSMPEQDGQPVRAQVVRIQAERQVVVIGASAFEQPLGGKPHPAAKLRAAHRGGKGRPGAEDREDNPLTLVDGSGESKTQPELHVEPRPEGMQLRIVRGAPLAEALRADGFVPDASGDGSWTCTTVDAAGFLTRIHHLQSMRVEIVYDAGACGATVGELLHRCLVVSRVTGTPWASGASRRRSRPGHRGAHVRSRAGGRPSEHQLPATASDPEPGSASD